MPPSTPASSPAAVERLQRFWNRALFCGVLLWTFLSLCFPLWDTDFWWHLRTGELIFQEGRVPQIDLYTYTDFDKPWIDLHWGFQLLIAGLYHLGGVDLVILVKAAVITGAVGLVWAAGGRNLPVWAKAAVWVLPVICVSGRGYERPEMLSQLFLAFWLWTAQNVERRPRWIWLLPLVQLMWVNCHALFILGLVVGGCYAVDGIARDFAGGRLGLAPPAREPSARAIIWSGALVAAASFANPYFEEGALFPFVLYRKFTVEQPFYSKLVGEFHRPIDFLYQFGWEGVKNIYLLAEAALWCVALASFICLVVRRGRWSPMRLLLFAGFSHLAWEATRNTNIFSLVAGYVACENFGEAFAAAPVRVGEHSLLRRTWAMSALVLGLVIAVVTGFWNDLGEKNKPFALGEKPDWFIHGAAKFAGQQGFPALAFVSHNGQAAVYEYHNGPDRRVFMDPRLEVCTAQTFASYNQILTVMAAAYLGNETAANSGAASGGSEAREEPAEAENPKSQQRSPPGAAEAAQAWPEMLRSKSGGELPVVILDNQFSVFQILGALQTPGWRLVYSDSAGSVFLGEEQAEKLKLPLVHLPRAFEERLHDVEARVAAQARKGRLQRLEPGLVPGAPD